MALKELKSSQILRSRSYYVKREFDRLTFKGDIVFHKPLPGFLEALSLDITPRLKRLLLTGDSLSCTLYYELKISNNVLNSNNKEKISVIITPIKCYLRSNSPELVSEKLSHELKKDKILTEEELDRSLVEEELDKSLLSLIEEELRKEKGLELSENLTDHFLKEMVDSIQKEGDLIPLESSLGYQFYITQDEFSRLERST